MRGRSGGAVGGGHGCFTRSIMPQDRCPDQLSRQILYQIIQTPDRSSEVQCGWFRAYVMRFFRRFPSLISPTYRRPARNPTESLAPYLLRSLRMWVFLPLTRHKGVNTCFRRPNPSPVAFWPLPHTQPFLSAPPFGCSQPWRRV